MLKGKFGALILTGLFAASVPALVGTSQAASLSEGVYYGNGNDLTNYAWTVDSENGVELGLQALTRYVGPVTPATTSVYDVGLGNTTQPLRTGSLWGFAYSAYDPNTLAPLSLSISILDYKYGTTVTFNPKMISDNGGTASTNSVTNDSNTVGGSDGCSAAPGSTACSSDTQTGIQNAETLSFANGVASVFDPNYDSGVDNTWLITLTASLDGNQVAQTSILVNAGEGSPLPEPFSLSVMGIGLVGMGIARRRRSTTRRT